MRIIRMTATFGKLDGETLDFRPGLNVITAPNEWGKSTWCAFLTAMLYGVDTRERSTQDRLADKEKYAPWSGRPMEGMLRIEHEGKDITIQRRTKGRVPLGDFLAYETMTGLAVPGLTGENCGQVLLGVERSVFQRTGFIRFSDLPVSQDEALRRRLNALVTTGDESGSADLLAKKLRELKNQCRYNRSGRIPEVKNQIQALRDQLLERENLGKQRCQLEDQILQIRNKLDELEVHRGNLAWVDAQEDRKKVEEAAQSAKFAQSALERLQGSCRNYPPRGELLAKQRQAQVLLEQIEEKKDEKPISLGPAMALWILAVMVLGAAVGLMAWNRAAVAAVTAAAGIVLALAAGMITARRRKAELIRVAERQKLLNRKAELTRASLDWQQKLADLEELERAGKEAEKTRAALQTLLSMARKAARPDAQDRLDLTREETMEQLTQRESQLRRCQLQLAQCDGRMETLPDREILLGQLELAKQRLERLEQTYLALDYAQKALEAAMQELQRRFAPRITRRAGEFLSWLTGGRYSAIAIGDDLTIRAAREEETTLRTAQWRSDGTGDQMYLALRLAVWEALTPNAPLVLDDALVRFDQERLEQAMGLLKELGRSKQILLFSCQDREERI